MRKFLFILLMGLPVGGCTVGPDYKAPEVAVPDSFSAAPTNRPTTRPVDLTVWWKTFGDPALDRLIEQSAAANHDLKIAESRVREARLLRKIAGADLYPNVNVGAGYRRTRFSENASSFTRGASSGGGVSPEQFSIERDDDFFQAGFDASWELDIFGGVRRSIEAAEAETAAAEEARWDVLVSLFAEVARNYVELRGFQRELQVTQENIRIQRETLEISEAKLKAGLASELDTQRAKAQLSSSESALPSLQTAIRKTIHRLGVLQGKEPGALVAELSRAAAIPAGPPEIPAGLPSELLRRRPDIRRSERQLAAATARIGVATAELFPKFTLTGAIGLQSNNMTELFKSGSDFWSIGPGVSFPVFNAGRLRANVEVEKERTEQASAAYERAVLTAMEDVENALTAYSQEQIRFRSLEVAVAANREAVGLARELYTRGVGDFLNVLDAQRALFLTEDQLETSRRVVSTNLVALYKALGGGWEPFEAGEATERAKKP